MIWTEELSASLDQAAGVVVFHRVELSRSQWLAQTVADKVNSMVEQSEKTLDLKLGGTAAWGDRADGGKGEKRGEQTQERRGRGERRGGARGKQSHWDSLTVFILIHLLFRCPWWW
jgi:translation initiation factor 3 subunit C